MKKSTITFMVMAFITSGCSNKQIYDSIQKNAQYECRKLPQSTYQKCKQHSESFESYTQKREDLLKL